MVSKKTTPRNFHPQTEEEWIARVKETPALITYNPSPSEAVQIAAINSNGFKYIKDPSEKMQLLAVKRNGFAIQFINDPSEAVQLAAVKQTSNAIEFIRNPTEDVQLAAVSQWNGWDIDHIENPSEKVKLAALKQSGSAIQYITDPNWNDPKVKKLVLVWMLQEIKSSKGSKLPRVFFSLKRKKCPWPEVAIIEKQFKKMHKLDERKTALAESRIQLPKTEQEWVEAVTKDPQLVRYDPNPSDAVIRAVAENIPPENEEAYLNLKRRGIKIRPEYVVRFLEKAPDLVNFMDPADLTEEVQLSLARRVSLRSIVLRGIKPSDAVVKEFIKYNHQNHLTVLDALENPSKQIQLAAIRNNGLDMLNVEQGFPELWADPQVKLSVEETMDRIRHLHDKFLIHLKVIGCTWPELDSMLRDAGLAGMDMDTAVRNDKAFISSHPNASDELKLELLANSGYHLNKIKNPTEQMKMFAVRKSPTMIRYVEDPSQALQLLAVNEFPSAIVYIQNPTESTQLAAVSRESGTIRYIRNPSERVQLTAVKRSSGAIHFIPDPSEKVQLAAVKKNPRTIGDIINPSYAAQKAAVISDPFSIMKVVNLDTRLWNDPEVKQGIIRELISAVKTEKIRTVAKKVKDFSAFLRDEGCNWPEVAMIVKRLSGLNP